MFILLAIGMSILSAAELLADTSENLLISMTGCIWFVASWFYLTKLKSSRIRTVGYWAAGIKVIDYRGKPPTLFAMTMRLFLLMIGPFNPITDLIWTGVDPNGRSLRDGYTGIHVVRRDAAPQGTAPRFLVFYTALGFILSYPSVKPKPASHHRPNAPQMQTRLDSQQ